MASPRRRRLAKKTIIKAREEADQPLEEEGIIEKVKKKGKKLLNKILGKDKKKKGKK